MKQSPDEAAVLARMAPGVLCRDGFLGADARSLREILDADAAEIERLGASHAAVAGRLAEVLEQAQAAFGAPVKAARDLTAVWHEAMGRIPSPWPGSGVFPKGEVELTAADGRRWRFTPLSVHLIATRGFYQGRGGRYRLEPAELVDILHMA
jgi:hypothetical protein